MKNQRGRKNQNGNDQAKYWNENPSLNARTIKYTIAIVAQSSDTARLLWRSHVIDSINASAISQLFSRKNKIEARKATGQLCGAAMIENKSTRGPQAGTPAVVCKIWAR